MAPGGNGHPQAAGRVGRPAFALALRLAVTATVLYVVLRGVDREGVAQTMAGADVSALLAALALQLLSVTLAVWRWRMVMRALTFPMGFIFYLRSYFKGTFFNQALPTSVGGDALRVLDVAGEGYRKRDALAGVAFDRVLGLVGLMLLALLASLAQPGLLPRPLLWWLGLLVAGSLAGLMVATQMRYFDRLDRIAATRPLRELSGRLSSVLAGPAAVALHTLLGLAVHALSMAVVAMVGWAVGMDHGIGTFFVLVPPAILLTLIPISIAGWGVREGALVGLFALVGAERTEVLSMSILYGLLLAVASLPGLVVYLQGRRRTCRAVSESEGNG